MPRAASKLTKRLLDSYAARAADDKGWTSYVADAGQPGLGVAIRRGRVRFTFRYRPPAGGKRRTHQIDHYGAITLDQARDIARDLRAQVAAGLDPQDEREREQRLGATVGDAVAGYLEDLRTRAETGAQRGKRSGYTSARRRLERHVLPALGKRRLRDVTAADVRQLHRSMQRTPVEANRTLSVFSAVFGWADRAEQIPAGHNPCRYVEKYAETGERRALTASELSALGDALHEAAETGAVEVPTKGGGTRRRTVPAPAVLAIRLMALTGFRRSEILGHMSKRRRGDREGLRWGDVDLDRGVVTLRDSKTGRQVRTLGAPAVEILRAARSEDATEDDPVVCSTRVKGQPFIGIDKPRRWLWEAAGLDGVDLHSLRHSFASIGAHVQGGRYAGHVAPLLGHGYQSRAITERYISSNPDALRPAADAIAGEIGRLLGLGEEGRVLSFPGEGAS
jgi:integrase